MHTVEILFWLTSILVVYVLFRVVRGNGIRIKRAIYPYPYSTEPGDRMFPPSEDKMGWAAYILISLGMLTFLGVIGFMFVESGEPPFWALLLVGGFSAAGGVLQKFSSYKGSQRGAGT